MPVIAPTILDLMEYANDAAAQAAFVSNGVGGSLYPPAQNTTYVKTTSESYNAAYLATDPTKSLIGSHTGTGWLTLAANANMRFHIDLGVAYVINKIYYENYHSYPDGDYTDRGCKDFTFWGSNIGAGSFDDLVYANNEGWTELTCSVNQMVRHPHVNASYPNYVTVINTTAYRYYAFKIVNNWGSAGGIGIRRIELQSVLLLQDYSEATIKQEGSYALKGVAAITASLNKTLTRTVSPTINLTDKTIIKFDIRASRTGSNIKIGIHDSGGQPLKSRRS